MEKPQTKLFIFDDDLSLITLLQRIAQPRFSRIHTAPSCRRALDLVSSDVEDFDLIVTAMLSKDFGLLEFFTQEVATIDNVRSVETFVVYKSFNLKVPLTGQPVPDAGTDSR